MDINSIIKRLDKIHSEVVFEEKQHKYFVDGIEYYPVTTSIGYYTGEFDATSTALRMSNGDQQQAQQLLDQWEQKSKYACSLGSLVHLFIEADIKQDEQTKKEAFYEIKRQFQEALPMLVKYQKIKEHLQTKKNLIVVQAEQRMYHPEARIAGTIDCLLYDKEKQCIHIVDWKTNQHFDNKSYNTLRFELSYMPATHLTKYSVQLSTYKQMLKLHGLPAANCYIVHLGGKQDTLSIYQCIDFHDKIQAKKMEQYATKKI